jgi:hypothetical protein
VNRGSHVYKSPTEDCVSATKNILAFGVRVAIGALLLYMLLVVWMGL